MECARVQMRTISNLIIKLILKVWKILAPKGFRHCYVMMECARVQMRTISNLIIKLILKVWNVVMVLSRVSRRGVVGHHDHLAALLPDPDSKLSASLPHHLGEVPSLLAVARVFKFVVLDLRIPTIN